MAAFDYSLVSRNLAAAHLVKRKSWPAKNVGVMVVFAIVFVVAMFLIFAFIFKKIRARRV
jgi:hypothetical protein